MQLFKKSFCNRRESLITVPGDIKFGFYFWHKWSEHKTTSFRSIDQTVKGQKVSETFFSKDRAVIGKTEGAF